MAAHPPGRPVTPEEMAALYEAAGGDPFLIQEALASTRMSQDSEAQTYSVVNPEPLALEVCHNCTYIIACGDCTDCMGIDRPGCVRCNSLAASWGVNITLGSTECKDCATGDCEPWFSTSTCQGCGDPLAGNRYHATGWIHQ